MNPSNTRSEVGPVGAANELVGTRFRVDDEVDLPLPCRREWVPRDIDL